MKYELLAKLGEYNYMKKFLLEGELYFRPLNEFAKMDENNGIGDKLEIGIEYTSIKPLTAKIITKDKNIIDLHPTNITYYSRTQNYCGHIYSMTKVLVNIENETLTFAEPDKLESIGNYNTIVLITNETEFIHRVTKALSKINKLFKYGSVNYFSTNNIIHHKIDAFQKRDIYSSQNEYRFFIQSQLTEPFIIKIGNITDIAILLSKYGFNSEQNILP